MRSFLRLGDSTVYHPTLNCKPDSEVFIVANQAEAFACQLELVATALFLP
jgi:hypothetical protein